MKKICFVLVTFILSGSLELFAQTDLTNVNTGIIQNSTTNPATQGTTLYTIWKYQGVEQGFLGYGSSNGGCYLFNNIGDLLLGTTNSTGFVTFHTGTSEKMRLTPEGRFGIGTTTPGKTLEVNGQIAGKQALYLNSNHSNSTEIIMEKPNSSYYSMGCNDDMFVFYNHSTAKIFMMADANDNIGIGTMATHNNKLAVAGNILAEKVKVKLQANWPDYVFEPAYKLPSLQELEAYVRIHKHLPDVPSAKEVAEKGLDLGDTQAILLKKIEELTLLLIEQNKKLESQESRLKLLEKK